MEYRIFYECNETGDNVPSSSPYVTDRDNMIAIGKQVLRADGDFFGVIDEYGKTLQFMVDGSINVRVEIPEPSKRGSWARTFSVSNIDKELMAIALPLDTGTTRDMVFESW